MNQKNIVLVTGTDTGVGKTHVTAGLARVLVSHKKHILAVKPVESGCTKDNLEDQDGRVLANATGQVSPDQAFDRLEAPLAPPVAADLQGRTLSMDRWCENIQRLAQTCELVLVEGAGGLLSPLTWTQTNLDLAQKCQARVLVVAENRLGVINQVLLVLRVLAQERLPICGVVLSTSTAKNDASITNHANALERFSGFDRVFCLPHIQDWSRAVPKLEPICHWVIP